MKSHWGKVLRVGAVTLVMAGIAAGVVVLVRRRTHFTKLRLEKSTMGSLREVAAALDAYAEANGHLPRIESLRVPTAVKQVRVDDSGLWRVPPVWPVQEHQRVELVLHDLVPAHVNELPTRDAWGRPLLCAFSAEGDKYTILSTGADGRIDAQHLESWDSDDSFRDIIVGEGRWWSSPAGTALRPY